MCFSTMQKREPINPNIFIDVTKIEKVDSTTIFGVKMDKYLTWKYLIWNQDVKHVVSEINSGL